MPTTGGPPAQSATQMLSTKVGWPFRALPLLQTVRTYSAKSLLVDVPTALTQAVLHIPQGMAYALLAGVAPIYGLYVSFIPPLVYALFSSTRHISIGESNPTRLAFKLDRPEVTGNG